MYDGLSRKDMQVILAHQVWIKACKPLSACMMDADLFLSRVEKLEAAREVKFCEFGEGDE